MSGLSVGDLVILKSEEEIVWDGVVTASSWELLSTSWRVEE